MRFRFTPKATVGYQDVIPLIASEARRRIDTVEQPDYVTRRCQPSPSRVGRQGECFRDCIGCGRLAYLNGKRCKDYVEELPQ